MYYNRKKNKKKSVNLITFQNPNSYISEQFRLVRNNIHFSSIDKEINSIVVTSPEPSDGKSTTAANLAIIMAQEEKKVILVDADLRKPSIHFVFNISNINGLTSVLKKEISIEQAIFKTSIHNLDILTSGPTPPNPSELLNSHSMELIIETLCARYDYIVFDTPPVLAVSDSQILAHKCDGVIMVVASRKTKKEQALKTKELLDKAKSNILGIVVSGVDSTSYGYYEKN